MIYSLWQAYIGYEMNSPKRWNLGSPMNSTSNKKTRKAGKAKRVKRSNNSRSEAMGAPAAVSNDLQQYTRFTGSKNGLVMHTCCAVAEINKTSTAPISGGALKMLGNNLASVQLNLTAPIGRNASGAFAAPFLSPVWDLIGSAFTRYRVRKLVFHYEPQAASTESGRLVFAFAEDPDHPLLWAAAPTSSNLLAVADSVAFMPWRPWSMDVTDKLDNTLYYTYDFNATATSATDRFSNFGVMACVTSDLAAETVVGGVLYMETEIELVEFCPVSVTRPALSNLARKLLPVDSEVVRKRDTEQDVIYKKIDQTYQYINR